MDHVAIMSKKLGLIDRILGGKKKIETRWYKNKVAPYNKIFKNDVIYFKDSGGQIRAKAEVLKVLQFENLDKNKIKEIINKYGDEIDIGNKNDISWAFGKNFAILIWLKDVEKINPFEIDKTGFGTGCAWLIVENIDIIRKQKPVGAGRLGNGL